jgi:uncharacterized repeat protein (TIGR03803 family)
MRTLRVKSLNLAKSLSLLAIALLLVDGAWGGSKFRVVYNFKGGTDGGGSWAGVTFDKNGNLFGTTLGGGGGRCNGGCGTVYKLKPNNNGRWTETVVHSFNYPVTGPYGGLVADPQGNLYGTIDSNDGGFLFEITSIGGWNQYVLPDGGSGASLLMDNTRNLYGPGGGGVYDLVPHSRGWQQNVIYTFHPQSGKNGTDGADAVGTLIADGRGNLYGATEFGGNYPPTCSGGGGCGTVFELSPTTDGKWKEHVLHRFAKYTNDGQLPMAGLVMDATGILYGTTYEGGRYQTGTIYKLTPDKAGRWKETILFDFPKAADGGGRTSSLVFDSKGNVYGTAGGGGGTCSCGVVFKLTPGTDGTWMYSVLHRFTGRDGGVVESGLTPDGRGNFYGTTLWGGTYLYGVVYEITP